MADLSMNTYLLAAALALSVLLAGSLALHTMRYRAVNLDRRGLGRTGLAATLAICGWCTYRLHAELKAPMWDPPVAPANPFARELERQFVGLSDRGREIPLYRLSVRSLPRDVLDQVQNDPDHPRYRMTVIAREGLNGSCNCYGWVFAGGKFYLGEDGVRTILRDNGYQRCSVPQTGDAVLYFAENQEPAHVGLVCSVLADGTVLVESKWGSEGRYLHRPEDQPYSQNFVYYRSQRGRHQITIGERNTALVKQRTPSRRRAGKA